MPPGDKETGRNAREGRQGGRCKKKGRRLTWKPQKLSGNQELAFSRKVAAPPLVHGGSGPLGTEFLPSLGVSRTRAPGTQPRGGADYHVLPVRARGLAEGTQMASSNVRFVMLLPHLNGWGRVRASCGPLGCFLMACHGVLLWGDRGDID